MNGACKVLDSNLSILKCPSIPIMPPRNFERRKMINPEQDPNEYQLHIAKTLHYDTNLMTSSWMGLIYAAATKQAVLGSTPVLV